MQNTVKQIFYDSDPEKAWICRFDVLQIKRDHRRILNVRPYFIYGPAEYIKFDNIKFKDFDIWVKVMSN